MCFVRHARFAGGLCTIYACACVCGTNVSSLVIAQVARCALRGSIFRTIFSRSSCTPRARASFCGTDTVASRARRGSLVLSGRIRTCGPPHGARTVLQIVTRAAGRAFGEAVSGARGPRSRRAARANTRFRDAFSSRKCVSRRACRTNILRLAILSFVWLLERFLTL